MKRTELQDLLISQPTREDAFGIIESKLKTGREIKAFAKFLDVSLEGGLPVIKDRIVNTTVGRKLIFQTIQEIKLK